MKRLVLFSAASLVLIVVMATFAFAQGRFRFPQPQVVFGNDIGFRLEGTDINGQPTGTLMVRVNGEWTEVAPSMTTRFLK